MKWESFQSAYGWAGIWADVAEWVLWEQTLGCSLEDKMFIEAQSMWQVESTYRTDRGRSTASRPVPGSACPEKSLSECPMLGTNGWDLIPLSLSLEADFPSRVWAPGGSSLQLGWPQSSWQSRKLSGDGIPGTWVVPSKGIWLVYVCTYQDRTGFN